MAAAAAEEASSQLAGLSDVFISEDIPVEGDISVPIGPSKADDEFSTLDEPVKETILRDLRAVGQKFIHVLYPKRSSALLRDWDLWGPLLLCVTLALLLQGGAADRDDQGGPQFAEVRTQFIEALRRCLDPRHPGFLPSSKTFPSPNMLTGWFEVLF